MHPVSQLATSKNDENLSGTYYNMRIFLYILSFPVAMGWGRDVEPKAKPGTPGIVMDEPDFVFPTRIMGKVTATVLGGYILYSIH